MQRSPFSGHDMAEHARLRSDASAAPSAWGRQTLVPSRFSVEPPSNLTQVSRTLAAHGFGEVAVDLVLDLMLHQVVEQAREASGASGAAIAIVRDGEMVCRATTGNAPDLGMRVETTSGLAGACVATGEIQDCHDTDTDTRVDAAACRRLGVRSMLIAPLSDGNKMFGILQVFSASPHAFGKTESSTLQVLAQRVGEARREAEAKARLAAAPPSAREFGEFSEAPSRMTREKEESQTQFAENLTARGNQVSSSLLVALIIAVAVLLGVLIGWRGAIKGSTQARNTASAAHVAPVATAVAGDDVPAASAGAIGSNSVADTTRLSNPNSPPDDGLQVTENGKIIYPPVPARKANPTRTPVERWTRPIYRVEPEYPTEARAQHIQGSVVLQVQISGDGAVGNIDVVSGDPLLVAAAVMAVKQWRYQPHFIGGKAAESQTRITVRFLMPPQ